MAKTQKTCKCCGKQFTYCPSCNYTEPAYKQFVCGEDCNDIWQALSRNGVGLASAQETIDLLACIKMPTSLQPAVKAHLDSLKASVKRTAKKVEPVVVVEETAQQVEDKPVVAKKEQKKDAEDYESPSQK